MGLCILKVHVKIWRYIVGLRAVGIGRTVGLGVTEKDAGL